MAVEAISTDLMDIFAIDNLSFSLSRVFLYETFNNLVNNKIPQTNIDRPRASLTFSSIFYLFLLVLPVLVDWLILLTSCTSLSFAIARAVYLTGAEVRRKSLWRCSFRLAIERHRQTRGIDRSMSIART